MVERETMTTLQKMDAAEDSLRVEIRFKNARLYDAIAAESVALSKHGNAQKLGPVKSFCELNGLNYGMVGSLLNLKMSPMCRRYGKLSPRPICQALCDLLMQPFDYLFPTELYSMEWTTTSVAINMAPSMVNLKSLRPTDSRHLLVEANQEEEFSREQLAEQITSVLGTLTPREEKVIALRYGLNGEFEHSLEDVAQQFGVTVERIRQIEAKAFRKLRHPDRSRRLRTFLEGRTDHQAGYIPVPLEDITVVPEPVVAPHVPIPAPTPWLQVASKPKQTVETETQKPKHRPRVSLPSVGTEDHIRAVVEVSNRLGIATPILSVYLDQNVPLGQILNEFWERHGEYRNIVGNFVIERRLDWTPDVPDED